MWDQIPVLARIASLVWLPAFVTVLIQGFRNRVAAWYWPLLCLIAYGPLIEYDLWRVRKCYSLPGRISYWVLVAAVSVMCLHHLLQRHAQKADLAVNERQ
jgi:hypothetical protein